VKRKARTPGSAPETARYLNLRQYEATHAWPSRNALQRMIWRFRQGDSAMNGFGRCLRRVGRTWVIDIPEMLAWIDSHRAEPLVAVNPAGNRSGAKESVENAPREEWASHALTGAQGGLA